MTELVKTNKEPVQISAVEAALIGGDLARLSAEQRVNLVNRICDSLGLNPLTKPFDYIMMQGKLTLYARKDCAEQLRKINGISVDLINKEFIDDLYIVTARASDRTGRNDEATGAVVIGGLKGEARANAIMKAETKAKRRVTLSISGLGFLDESETPSVITENQKAAVRSQAEKINSLMSSKEISNDLPVDNSSSASNNNRIISISKVDSHDGAKKPDAGIKAPGESKTVPAKTTAKIGDEVEW